MAMNYAIELEDLSVVFNERGQRVEALRGLSLQVEEGSVFGFLGPNGAGKTTVMHVMLGFVELAGGEARLFGQDVRRTLSRARIGYLPENPQTYPFLTGRELLTMAGNLFGLRGSGLRGRVDDLLERVDLAAAANRRIATYSRGMLQRIGLAQALINDPDLVILDEPTGGMDPLGRMDIRAIIADLRGRGKTVFFSSHELSEVELTCDRMAIMVRGRLAREGTAAELREQASSLEQYFLDVVRSAEGGEL
jgi:ABC-2 type transport system ATP-binding protein